MRYCSVHNDYFFRIMNEYFRVFSCESNLIVIEYPILLRAGLANRIFIVSMRNEDETNNSIECKIFGLICTCDNLQNKKSSQEKRNKTYKISMIDPKIEE